MLKNIHARFVFNLMLALSTPYHKKMETNNSDTTQDKNEPNPLWTVKDVARYLRLEPETVRTMARRKDLPALKIGRVWRFSKKLLDIWLNKKYKGKYTITSNEESNK